MKRRAYLVVLLMIAYPLMAEENVVVGLAANFSALNDTMWNTHANHFRNGVRLALLEFQPQLDRAKVSISTKEFDYGNERARAAQSAVTAVQSKAVAVIGYPYSSEVLIAGPIFQEGKLLLFTPSASADRIGEIGKYVRTCSFSNGTQGLLLSRFAQQKGLKNIGIISRADCAYCQSLRNSFVKSHSDRGGKVSVDEVLLENQVEDVTALHRIATKLNATSLDAIFLPDYERVSATLIAALYDRGVRPRLWFGGDGWGGISELFLRIVGKRPIEGYTLAHWNKGIPTSESKRFYQAFRESFQKEPNDIAAVSYEAMKLLIIAILRAKEKDRASVLEELEKLDTFSGLAGSIDYEKGRTTPRKVAVLLRFTAGKVVFAGKVGGGK